MPRLTRAFAFGYWRWMCAESQSFTIGYGDTMKEAFDSWLRCKLGQYF